MEASPPAGPGRRAADARLPAGQVTFVFTDIEGSTALFSRIGAAYVELLERHNAILRTAFTRFSGFEVKASGDGLFLAFTSTREAFEGCAAAQQELAAASWPEGAPIRVRMGVHVGPADPRDGDYIALAVNQAARICAAAHGGQVLMSAGAVEAAGGDVPRRDLGRFLLHGFPTPVTLSQLLARGLEEDFPAPRARRVATHNLPEARTPFIGRTSERDAAVRALGRSRLVTLVGPGGAGKTRLAYESAGAMLELMPDGVWRVALAGIRSPDLVAGAVAAELDLPADGDEAASVADGLSGRELVLVLDNCEHVIDAAARLADGILAAARGVRILATSREPLGVEGETVLRVGGLGHEDAMALLYARVEAARPDFVPSAADEAAARELHDRLDGLPLALELAAARSSAMSLPEIAAGLRDPLRLLAGVRRGGEERHGSLRAVLDWSHDLLEPDEQVLLRRLSVLVGAVELDTIERACRGAALATTDIAQTLVRLVERNLVVADPRGATTRYRLLEPVRAYAAERLEGAGEGPEARRHLLEWAIELAEANHDGVGDLDALRDRVSAEHGAMLEALTDRPGDEADPDGRLRLAGAMARRWALDRPAEAVGLLERALEDAPDAAPAVRLRALSGLARVLDMLTQSDDSLERERAALALAGEVGASADVAWSLATLATHLAFFGHAAEADERLSEAHAMAEKLDDDQVRAVVLRRRAYVLRARGDHAGAWEAARRGLELGERTRDDEAILAALVELGIAANYAGDCVAAEAYGDRAILLAREHGLARAECLALSIVALAATLAGRFERAAEAIAEALALARGHRLIALVRDCLDFAAVLLDALGRPEDAAVAHGAAAAYPRDSTNPQADAAIERVRAQLGGEAFADACARGPRFSPEDLDRYLLAAIAGASEQTPITLGGLTAR